MLIKRRAFTSGALSLLILASLPGCGQGTSEDSASGQGENARRPEGSAAEEPPAGASPVPDEGQISAMATHVALSPRAQILAESLMCVCGCGMRLGDCTCAKDPGGITMKRHLQSLVDEGLTPSEVKAAMVEKFGPAVLP